MNLPSLSARLRKQTLEHIAAETFDLLIIGGGITGAGIALDAATRGLKTVLLEMGDFAGGTSSRSTKLIHGGLRYLKQMEFGLVREVGLERAVAHRNARHLVVPERMLLPIVEGGTLGKRMTSLGLWVYDYLAGVPKAERRRMLNAEETLRTEPLLRQKGLKGGGLYFEYRTDDARLTIELIKTAVLNGATCLNYTEVKALCSEGGRIKAVEVLDKLNDTTHTLRAKLFVNAAGPWVDELRRKDLEGVKNKRLHLTKGVHLVVPYEKLPLQQAAYFDTGSDGRTIFAVPRGMVTYIGTTDTNYAGEIAEPITTEEDVNYLLAATNSMFPSAGLKPYDVISTWAGLRPLIHEAGKSPSELSRKDEIFQSETGLISIAGGKLTGYRKMAERIVDLVCKRLGKRIPCQTKDLRLAHAGFESQEAIEDFIARRTGEVQQIGLGYAEVASLTHRYGTATQQIIEKAFELYPSIGDAQERLLTAEIWYCVEHEMVCTLSDFLIRRTGKLYFERESLLETYPHIGELLGRVLSLSEEQVYRNLAAFQKELEQSLAFRRELSVS